MADARIQDLDLIQAQDIQAQDRTVLEHADRAYAMEVQSLVNAVLEKADGHGGIRVPYHLISSEGLTDTYECTYADGTTSTYQVQSGESGVHYGADLPNDRQDVWVDPSETQEDLSVLKDLDDRYCRHFELTAPVATCHPVEGYPLAVKSQIAPSTEGKTQVKLKRCGENLADKTMLLSTDKNFGTLAQLAPNSELSIIPAGFTVNVKLKCDQPSNAYWNSACGCFSDNTGFQVSAGESWYTVKTTKTSPILKNTPIVSKSPSSDNVKITATGLQFTQSGISDSPYKGKIYTADFGQTVYGGEVDWNTWTVTSTTGPDGLPLPAPAVIDLPGEKPVISAIDGVNTLYSDTGDTTVSGAEDPNYSFARLKNAILSQGGNV